MPSNNPYTSSYVENYFAQMSPEDKAKLMPMFQNAGQQQNFENQMIGQTGELAQQAGQPGNNQMAGMNNALMAALLRKGGDKTVQSAAQKKEIGNLGSNTWNPYSDYNTGANGWGNYGE